ncbi:MAG TPA: glycosyltransferase family 39 protein [Thermoanaerobaculia bacterium]|nr:glycosyltransferase family 39 protein [Thermoanaerobaculia bacterium]
MHRRWLLSIAVLAFLLHFAYAAASGSLRNPRVWEVEQIATDLTQSHAFFYKHEGTIYRAYAEPLWPFVAAAVYAVTGHSRMAMVLLQIAIASITVWLTGRLASSATGDEAAGNVAALLMAIHPGFITYSSILHPLTLDTFFLVAAALAIIARRWYAAAALIGLGALTRPTILLLTGFQRRIAAVAITLAIVAPWTIRNAVVLHDFVLTRSGTGFVFWLGNNPNATGSAVDVHRRPLLDAAPPEFQARIRAADELARDRLFRDAAWTYIAANPLAAAGRVAQRLFYFWWFSPEWGAHYSAPAKIVYRVWWACLLFLFALGAIKTRRREVWLLVAMAVLVSLVQSLFYVEGRHRLAVEPLILPMAALSLVKGGPRWLHSQRSGSRSSSPPRSSSSPAISFGWPFPSGAAVTTGNCPTKRLSSTRSSPRRAASTSSRA